MRPVRPAVNGVIRERTMKNPINYKRLLKKQRHSDDTYKEMDYNDNRKSTNINDIILI